VAIEDDIAFIERVPTLQMLGRTALRILAIGAESRYVHQGEVLFLAGEAADSGFIIQEGSFRLDSNTKALGEVVIGAGALLGELALIAATKRPATATANEPSTVIRISRSLFLKMLEGYPDAAVKLRNIMAERLNNWERELAGVKKGLNRGEAP